MAISVLQTVELLFYDKIVKILVLSGANSDMLLMLFLGGGTLFGYDIFLV